MSDDEHNPNEPGQEVEMQQMNPNSDGNPPADQQEQEHINDNQGHTKLVGVVANKPGDKKKEEEVSKRQKEKDKKICKNFLNSF
ncbi:MAG: hypothetical protein MJ252_03795 [archaeon]|nr:hypothetical protein [archaeon]